MKVGDELMKKYYKCINNDHTSLLKINEIYQCDYITPEWVRISFFNDFYDCPDSYTIKPENFKKCFFSLKEERKFKLEKFKKC